ncbi:MAG: hypothetical protein ACI9QL_004193 [Candidatus Omnitrophota bacterium]|jgi:hypothetical protein
MRPECTDRTTGKACLHCRHLYARNMIQVVLSLPNKRENAPIIPVRCGNTREDYWRQDL